MTFEPAELSVGGGTLALSPYPSSVDVLVGWDLVISLTETADFSAHAGWRHFPIVDFDIPTGDWQVISGEVHQVLARGGNVLFHCKAGCGRSGMSVLRIMTELGEPDALARLRAVRPCAVETDAQMVWALDV